MNVKLYHQNHSLMKNFFVSALLLVHIASSAKSIPDSVAMIVGDKQVPMAEFLYAAAKNGENNLSDKKELKTFVRMFEDFKLKVVDAESWNMDKTNDFKEELEKYRSEQVAGYLSDKKAEEKVVENEYERTNEILDLSHIPLFLPERTVGKDTVSEYQRALEIRNSICWLMNTEMEFCYLPSAMRRYGINRHQNKKLSKMLGLQN